jgi:mersacidin/lichenicidin family type 2 lantibiotic
MSKKDVIRAWKDPNYRKSLSAAELAALPANPAGAIELTDAELGGVSGGFIKPTYSKYCNFTDRISCDICTNWPKGKLC